MPQLLEFMEQQQDKAVAFFAINVGETTDQVRPFIESQGYTSPVVLDLQQVASRAFRVTSLPACVPIDSDGTIQAVHVGACADARQGISHDLIQLLTGEIVAP